MSFIEIIETLTGLGSKEKVEREKQGVRERRDENLEAKEKLKQHLHAAGKIGQVISQVADLIAGEINGRDQH